MTTVPSGAEPLDHLLEGGFDGNIITTIYGPSGSGKTNIALLAALTVAASGKKVIFIDTEGGVAVDRAIQMRPDGEELLKNVFFLSPTNFQEQKSCVEKLSKLVNDGIGLIVIDSIAMLYRLAMGRSDHVYEINRELGLQLGQLTHLVRTKNLPVLLTNQIYNSFDDAQSVNLVGGDVIRYGSKCLIELQVLPRGGRRAILRKHRYLPEERSVTFRIINTGLELIKEEKNFDLF